MTQPKQRSEEQAQSKRRQLEHKNKLTSSGVKEVGPPLNQGRVGIDRRGIDDLALERAIARSLKEVWEFDDDFR